MIYRRSPNFKKQSDIVSFTCTTLFILYLILLILTEEKTLVSSETILLHIFIKETNFISFILHNLPKNCLNSIEL